MILAQVASLRKVPDRLMEPPSTDYDDCLKQIAATPLPKTAATAQAPAKWLSDDEMRAVYICQASKRKLTTEKLIGLQSAVTTRQKAVDDLERYLASKLAAAKQN